MPGRSQVGTQARMIDSTWGLGAKDQERLEKQALDQVLIEGSVH